MSALIKLEWRDGELTVIDASGAGEHVRLERAGEPGSFVVAPGLRQSGEILEIRRLPDGRVASLLLGGGSLVRLDPMA